MAEVYNEGKEIKKESKGMIERLTSNDKNSI